MIRSTLKILIRGYQLFLAPVLPPACRFHPSCSEYSRQALDQWPLHKALVRIVARLSKCHPFHAGGHDPVQ